MSNQNYDNININNNDNNCDNNTDNINDARIMIIPANVITKKRRKKNIVQLPLQKIM